MTAAHDTDNIPNIPGVDPHPLQVAEQARIAAVMSQNTNAELPVPPPAENVKDMSAATRQVLRKAQRASQGRSAAEAERSSPSGPCRDACRRLALSRAWPQRRTRMGRRHRHPRPRRPNPRTPRPPNRTPTHRFHNRRSPATTAIERRCLLDQRSSRHAAYGHLDAQQPLARRGQHVHACARLLHRHFCRGLDPRHRLGLVHDRARLAADDTDASVRGKAGSAKAIPTPIPTRARIWLAAAGSPSPPPSRATSSPTRIAAAAR